MTLVCVKCVEKAVALERTAVGTDRFHFVMVPDDDISGAPVYSAKFGRWRVPAAATIKSGDALCIKHLFNLV